MSIPEKHKFSPEALLKYTGEPLIWLWAPAAKGKREAKRDLLLSEWGVGMSYLLTGKSRILIPLTCLWPLTGSQAWLFSWVTPLIFTNPLS